MRGQPFHHGNLRAALLDRAEQMLREGEVEGLSLRELARQTGVSHGAPRSHFIDRQALLDALAERGFTRLADDVTVALASEQDDVAGRLRAAARAYVRFAVTDAALLELMFAAKNAGPSDSVLRAAEQLFVVFGGLMEVGIATGQIRSENALPHAIALRSDHARHRHFCGVSADHRRTGRRAHRRCDQPLDHRMTTHATANRRGQESTSR